MNLELDLGLDSLARAECAAGIEQAGIAITPEDAASALTVGDFIRLVASKSRESGMTDVTSAVATDWHEILSKVPGDLPDIQPILERKPVFELFAYVVLRFIRGLAAIFCRMEVKGLENLSGLQSPFLVCPNHQSFLDPFPVGCESGAVNHLCRSFPAVGRFA